MLLMVLVPAVLVVIRHLMLGARARKDKDDGDRGGLGLVARIFVPRLFHWLAREFEEDRDLEMFDLGEIKLEFRPEGSAKTDRAADSLLVVRHARDVSYAAIAGIRLKSWPSRIEVVSLGGHVFAYPAYLDRGWRRARSVHMVFEEDGEALDHNVFPVLRWWQGPASAIKALVGGAPGGKLTSTPATDARPSLER